MSILIRGMEMPPQGEFKHIRIYDNGEVTVAVDTGEEVYEAVIANAVPVPPHGRLIDADAFERQNAYFWNRDFINPKYPDTLADLVNDAPTIIPAEEGE